MGQRESLTVSALIGLALLGGAVAQAPAEPEPRAPMTGINATAFPDSDDVLREYDTDTERLAALAVLLDLLQFKTEDKSPLALERQTDYRRTIARLDPPRAADDQRAAARTLRRDQSFQNAVVKEFLPAYAPQAAKAAALARAAPNQASVGALWTSLVAGIGAALLFPVVVMLKRRR